MAKRFQDVAINRENMFTLGRDQQTGDAYLSIPVVNRIVDYDEYYRLSEEEFERLRSDEEAGAAFAKSCRERREDERLILQPGADRGTPR